MPSWGAACFEEILHKTAKRLMGKYMNTSLVSCRWMMIDVHSNRPMFTWTRNGLLPCATRPVNKAYEERAGVQAFQKLDQQWDDVFHGLVTVMVLIFMFPTLHHFASMSAHILTPSPHKKNMFKRCCFLKSVCCLYLRLFYHSQALDWYRCSMK